MDEKLKETCLEISKRYEMAFIEIGTDQDHVHFLVQAVPMYSPKKIVQVIKRHYGTGDIELLCRGKEKALGRRILERGVLCEHGWATWQ